MFNRSTKLTALLVAAASVASMTPVMALEKLNQKDATVKEGVAYDNGKYAYYGYRTDDDDTAIYYNNGSDSKDKEMDSDLEDYEISYENQIKYGTKYLYVTEDGNNDEYLIDLSTGKVVDDETAESKQDSAQSKLISKLKKTERYNKTSDSDHAIDANNTSSNRLFKNQFGDVWYQYVVATTDNNTAILDSVKNGEADVTTGAGVSFGQEDGGVYTGFFDENGKYIDASYLANLRIYNPRKDKATIIEKFGKIYKDEALKADLKALKPIAQDKDYLYAVATVDVTYYPLVEKKDENGKVTGTYYDFEAENLKPVTQYFVQKISKAQGDKQDGAYVPKNVTSYQLDGDEKAGSVYGTDGDREKAYKALVSEDPENCTSDILYAVKGDYIYATYIKNDDKVQTYKIKLGKDKLDVNFDSKEYNTDTKKGLFDGDKKGEEILNSLNGLQSFKGKSIDTNIAVKSDDDDYDYEIPVDEDGNKDDSARLHGVSVDVEGNTWVIYHGKIAMFDGSEFKDKYATDRSYDRLDVYDKDSLLAWSQDTDSYTTVKEGKAQTVSDAKEIDSTLVNGGDNNNTTVKTGWVQEADGTWSLYDATGAKTVGWANVSGTWYYMDAAGAMQTGWVQDAGNWYYLNPVSDGTKGAMKTGWVQVSGVWYYLESSGAMAANKWIQDNGTWYYLKASGAMAANEYIDGYWVNASGAYV